jgi:uncharacterized membrane protein
MAWFGSLRERLRQSLWFIPGVLVALAWLLAVGLGALDRQLSLADSAMFFAFGGSPEGARSVLSAIAQSMLTFTGLVFSITMLVLQLASSQLSPRVMRTFLRDRGNQVVLGMFVATFVFALLVLREVRTATDGAEPFVPAISVSVAFGLLLASVIAFVWYIDHMAHAIRANTVIARIWEETVEAVERLYPDRIGREPAEAEPEKAARPSSPDLVLKSTKTGIVVSVDEDRLLDATRDGDRVLELVPAVGEFVAEGSSLALAWGRWDPGAVESVRRAVVIDRERTIGQDAAFGFRQLVDVALRALSPGTNDPTTAVQALDRLHDLLRRLADRRFPSPARLVDDHVRLVLPRPDWDGYVHLAVAEIRLAGERQLQVVQRLRWLLVDLASIVPPERLPAIRQATAELDAGILRAFATEDDRAAARLPRWRGGLIAGSPVEVASEPPLTRRDNG